MRMMFKKRIFWVAALVAILVVALGAVTLTAVAQQGDDDKPITGPALEQATKAALDYTGGGRVTGTEVGDEESYYEVEVTLDDGSQVDVQLDESFNVVSQTADHEGADDQDGANDD
jgi:uncharacterized membrane protein YkoI